MICCALSFEDTKHKLRSISATQRRRELPIIHEAQTSDITWGRSTYEKSLLPLGFCCRIDQLQKGAFDCWQPKKVLLPARKFAVRNVLSQLFWFEVSRGEFLEGIVLQDSEEKRVYLSTLFTERVDNLFWIWPLIQRVPDLPL